jgi:hypothetical protein
MTGGGGGGGIYVCGADGRADVGIKGADCGIYACGAGCGMYACGAGCGINVCGAAGGGGLYVGGTADIGAGGRGGTYA